MPPRKIVIIGNGVAANSAAATVRRLSADARITLVSDEPHPFYSACALPYYISGEKPRRRMFLKTKTDYRKDGVRALLGRRVRAVDLSCNQVELVDDSVIDFDKLILATGATPVMPTLPGVELDGVCTFKTLADSDFIAAHTGAKAVVLGTGPIGMEAAIALKKKGYQVSAVGRRGWILPRVFDPEASKRLAQVVEDAGVTLYCGEQVLRLLGENKVEAVATDKHKLECDLVIIAAGMRPEVSLAMNAGIQLGKLGGIATDGQMKTSAPGVFACGDCVENVERVSQRPFICMLWPNAQAQGIVAGYNAVGELRTFPGSQNITAVNAFGSYAYSIGSNLADLAGEDGVDVTEKERGGAYYRLVTVKGIVRGAQVLGETQIVGPLLNTIRRGLTLDSVRAPGSQSYVNIWQARIWKELLG